MADPIELQAQLIELAQAKPDGPEKATLLAARALIGRYFMALVKLESTAERALKE